jgi:hypothetical protein
MLRTPTKFFHRRRLLEEDRKRRMLDFHRLDLEQVFQKHGCPICLLLKKHDVKGLDSLLYELVNDVSVRNRIRKALGFCNYHASVLEQIATTTSRDLLSTGGAALGIGIIYLDLVETLIKQLKTIPTISRTRGISIGDELCPLCDGRNELEIAYCQTVLLNINDFNFQDKYSASDGLCAIHMDKTFKLRGYSGNKKKLASIETTHLELLTKELHEFVRKHDYRYSKEGFAKEADSWLRALRKISGYPFTAITKEKPP